MRHPLDAFAGDFKRWSADDWKARADRAEARVVELEKALGAIVQTYEATKRDDCMDLPRPVLNLLIQVASASALLASDTTRCAYRDGAGRECRLRRESAIHQTDHANVEVRTAAHVFAPDTTYTVLADLHEQESEHRCTFGCDSPHAVNCNCQGRCDFHKRPDTTTAEEVKA